MTIGIWVLSEMLLVITTLLYQDIISMRLYYALEMGQRIILQNVLVYFYLLLG